MEKARTPATIDQFGDGSAYSFLELHQAVLPEQKQIVPGMLPVGLALLVGRPKMAKSIMALNACCSVCTGGEFLGVKVEQGGALYFALEDGKYRLNMRVKRIFGENPRSDVMDNSYCLTDMPALDEGGLEAIEKWLTSHPHIKLIVLDPLGRILSRAKGGQNIFQHEYKQLAPLQRLALAHGVCILIIHHQRKQMSQDIVDSISGSMAIAAVADSILILRREARTRTDAVLSITGRDIPDQELALSFNSDNLTWSCLGNAEDYSRSKERTEIVDLLKGSELPLRASEIARALGKNEKTTGGLLAKLVVDGAILKSGYGQYAIKH